MVRLTRIYTRSGDGGTTRLATGEAVAKDDPRVALYGTVDELNASVGLAVAMACRADDLPQAQDLVAVLRQWQHVLFDLGAELASTPERARPGAPRVERAAIEALEAQMDAWNATLGPLEGFVLPGGHPVAAALHVARTVCRRAERLAVATRRRVPIRDVVVAYLNRLGDALFVAARHVDAASGTAEALWTARRQVPEAQR